MILVYAVRQLQQRVSKLGDVDGILSKMYRIYSVNIRRAEIQRASLKLQPTGAHAATFFAFVDVVKNIFSLINFESQFIGYSHSEKIIQEIL
jgi:hypothetical protein